MGAKNVSRSSTETEWVCFAGQLSDSRMPILWHGGELVTLRSIVYNVQRSRR